MSRISLILRKAAESADFRGVGTSLLIATEQKDYDVAMSIAKLWDSFTDDTYVAPGDVAVLGLLLLAEVVE